MTLKCAIIDDEPLAVELLSGYVRRTPFLSLNGGYTSAVSAIKALREQPVDVLFLDALFKGEHRGKHRFGNIKIGGAELQLAVVDAREVQHGLDEARKRFATVFPACGSANSAIELTIPELEQYSGCDEWVDVCKDWQAASE